MDFKDLTTWITAVAAVGTAAMGLVEAFKWTRLGRAGLSTVRRDLGTEALDALKRIFGAQSFDNFLEGAWRKGEVEFQKTLGDGLRLAVFQAGEGLDGYLKAFGEPDPQKLVAAITLLRTGDADPAKANDMAAARSRLARFEAVVDARVRSAVAAGRDRYIHVSQLWASGVAVVGGCIGSNLMQGWSPAATGYGILVGLLAVPVAPAAKDILSFLTSLRDVFSKPTKAG